MSPRALVSSLPSGLVPGSKRKHPHGPGSCNQHNKCNPFMVLIMLLPVMIWYLIFNSKGCSCCFFWRGAWSLMIYERALHFLWHSWSSCVFSPPFVEFSSLSCWFLCSYFVQTTPDLKAPFMRMSENEYTIFKLHRLCQWETEIRFCTVWKLCCIFHWGWMGMRFSMCTTSYIYIYIYLRETGNRGISSSFWGEFFYGLQFIYYLHVCLWEKILLLKKGFTKM